MAPANPSAQDRKVAAMATNMLQKAMTQILQEKQQQSQKDLKNSADEAKSVAENSINGNGETARTKAAKNAEANSHEVVANQRKVNRAISSYGGKQVFGA